MPHISDRQLAEIASEAERLGHTAYVDHVDACVYVFIPAGIDDYVFDGDASDVPVAVNSMGALFALVTA